MGGKIYIVTGQKAITNYQPEIYFIPPLTDEGFKQPTVYVSWITISISDYIEPGTYDIPEDQQNNLDWFTENNYRTDKYCRRHLGYIMADNSPTQVLIV